MASIPSARVPARFAAGCLFLFGLPFAGAGVFALIQAVRELLHGDKSKALFLALFAVAFTGVGVGVMCAAFFGSKAQKQQAAREAAHPDEPWLWRDDWARGEIKSSQRTLRWFAWGFALFWNTVSTAAALAVLQHPPKSKAAYLVMIFPAVGIGLLAWAARLTWQWRRFGNPVFRMAAVPGVVGGALAGVVHSARTLHRAQEIRLRLACLERDSSGENTTERLRWEDEKVLLGEILHEGGGIPILFNIPFDATPSQRISASRHILWRLEVRAVLRGTDFEASFEVPVYKTSQSRADAAPLPDPAAVYEKQIDFARSPGIRVQPAASGGIELVFSAARNKGAAISLTVFVLLWTAAIGFMIRLGAPILFPIVFGLFELLLLAGLPSLWLSRSRVIADPAGLRIATRTFFEKKRILPAAEIRSVEPKFSMSAGARTYYDLLAVTNAGPKVVLARYVRSKREVEWLVQEIKKALRKQ